MDHDDFAFDTAPGLDKELRPGEEILWQGRPATWPLAKESFALKWVFGYFVLLAAWSTVSHWDSTALVPSITHGVPYLLLGLVAVGVLTLISWAQARATIYTVTTDRVVMRMGAALVLTLNLPFTRITGASVDLRKGGTGTIAFETVKDAKLSYMMQWPHVRPWKMAHTQPALRCIPDAKTVADLIAETAESRLARPTIVSTKAPKPVEPLAAEPTLRPAE